MQQAQEIKIEKNIPIKRSGSGTGRWFESKYPWREMKVGDSFQVKIKDKFLKKPAIQQSSIMTSGRTFLLYNKMDWKFVTRKVDDKYIRVWRVK